MICKQIYDTDPFNPFIPNIIFCVSIEAQDAFWNILNSCELFC